MSIKRTRNTKTQLSSESEQLNGLNRTPAKCPVTNCPQLLFPSALLSHYLTSHAIDQKIQLREAFDSQRSLLMINANRCPFGQNVCLGAIAYGGTYDVSATMPAIRPICYPNMGLSSSFDHLKEHLPVLIMMCETSWGSLLHNKNLQRDININDQRNRIYVIWCVSCACTKNIYATLTIFDKLFSQSRSGIRLVRDFTDNQNIDEFLLNDMNYIVVTSTDIEKLSDPIDKCIHLEIILHENPTLLKTFMFDEKRKYYEGSLRKH